MENIYLYFLGVFGIKTTLFWNIDYFWIFVLKIKVIILIFGFENKGFM
jgi:hypothetical protein